MATTSATRRLHRLLTEFRRIANAQGGGTRVEQVLRELVKLPPGGSAREVYDVYLAMIRLSDRAVHEVRASFTERYADELILALQPIQTAQSVMLTNGLGAHAKTWAEVPLDSLNQNAAYAARVVVGEDATDEDLQTVKTHLSAILEQILAASVSDQLKELFRESIARLLEAIDRYRIFGADAVNEELVRMTVQVYSAYDAKRRKEGAAVRKWMTQIANILSIASSTAQIIALTGGHVQLLGPGQPPPPPPPS